MKTIKLFSKRQYFGRLYPADSNANHFCQLLNTSSIPERRLQWIQKLGFTIEIQRDEKKEILLPIKEEC
jgi:hypothetical protein